MKEAEDSSLVDHTSTLLLSKSIHTTQRVSRPQVSHERQKTRGTSHPEKFEERALDGHHRDYILLLFVELAHKSTLVYFLFSFLVTLG